MIELLTSCLQLQSGKISHEDWLIGLNKLVNCDASACVRWTIGQPDYAAESVQGDLRDMPAGWRIRTDQAVSNSSYRQTGFIEDFEQSSRDSLPATLRPPNNDRLLLAIVDWEPACIALLMVRHPTSPAWSSFERNAIQKILPYVRESIVVHKELDRFRYNTNIANDVLNSSPVAIFSLFSDGTTMMANTRAEEMLLQNDGLTRTQGKLVFSDRSVAARLQTYLAELQAHTGKDMTVMDWKMTAARPSGKPGYQAIITSVHLPDWKIESRSSDRAAIVYLHDPTLLARPSNEHLQKFYGLSKAQARLAETLCSGKSINQAANELHISINTARSHMRSIYAKTGVKTQAALMSLLAAGLSNFA